MARLHFWGLCTLLGTTQIPTDAPPPHAPSLSSFSPVCAPKVNAAKEKLLQSEQLTENRETQGGP